VGQAHKDFITSAAKEMNVVMATTSGDPLLDFLLQGGAVGVLSFIVIGFLKGWIVAGRELTRVTAERDRALELVYKQAELTQRAIELSAEKSAS
jgi:hypothetical protein